MKSASGDKLKLLNNKKFSFVKYVVVGSLFFFFSGTNTILFFVSASLGQQGGKEVIFMSLERSAEQRNSSVSVVYLNRVYVGCE